MTEKKVAKEGVASEKPQKQKMISKKSGKETSPAKKIKYVNPFSFTDELQMKFVNCIMKNGKKVIAQKILRGAFDEMHRKGVENVLETFEKAYANATPTMEVKPKRVGGGIYQIPMEVSAKRQRSLAIRWILEGARKRKGMPMARRLALELLDAASETGFSYTKREDAHRMAAANKAFAHLARY